MRHRNNNDRAQSHHEARKSEFGAFSVQMWSHMDIWQRKQVHWQNPKQGPRARDDKNKEKSSTRAHGQSCERERAWGFHLLFLEMNPV